MEKREGYQWLYREQRGRKGKQTQSLKSNRSDSDDVQDVAGGSEEKVKVSNVDAKEEGDENIDKFLCSDEVMQKAVSGSLKITNAFYAELDSPVDVPKDEKVTQISSC